MRKEVKAGIIVAAVGVAAVIILLSTRPEEPSELPFDKPNNGQSQAAADTSQSQPPERTTTQRRDTSTSDRRLARGDSDFNRFRGQTGFEERTGRTNRSTNRTRSESSQSSSASGSNSFTLPPVTRTGGGASTPQSGADTPSGSDAGGETTAPGQNTTPPAGSDDNGTSPSATPGKVAGDADTDTDERADAQPSRTPSDGTVPNRMGNASRTQPEPAVPPRRAQSATNRRTTSAPTPSTHTIEAGDTFYAIAEKVYGDSKYFKAIVAANPDVNPAAVPIGATIKLPPKSEVVQERPSRTAATEAAREAARAPGPLEYVVERGDSLTKIAANWLDDGNRWREIYELNRDKLSSPDRLLVGMKLKLPPKGAAAGGD